MRTELPIAEATESTLTTLTDVNRLTQLSVVLAVVSAGLFPHEMIPLDVLRNQSTQSAAEEVLLISSSDVVDAILDIHRGLLSRTRELDPVARDVLYDNLWDLYRG